MFCIPFVEKEILSFLENYFANESQSSLHLHTHVIMFVSVLLHASSDTLFLFFSFLLVLVIPYMILTTEPENTNPTTTIGVTVICSVISHPQIEELTLTYMDNEINSGENILVSNTIGVSVVVLVSHGLFLQGVGVTFVTKSYRKIVSTWSSVTDQS